MAASFSASASGYFASAAPVAQSINSTEVEKEFFAGFGVSQANHNQSILLNAVSGLKNSYKSDTYNAGSYLLGFGLSKHYKTLPSSAKVYLGIEAAYLVAGAKLRDKSVFNNHSVQTKGINPLS